MLNFNSIMIGTSQIKVMGEFYEKVFGRKSDMGEGEGWYGWKVGETYLNIGEHSEVKGKAAEPQRIILNLETPNVKEEFQRIKSLGAEVIKEPYGMTETGELSEAANAMWIATFADPDGNYFQLMSPWEGKAN